MAAPKPVLPIARNFLQNPQAIAGRYRRSDLSNGGFPRNKKPFPNDRGSTKPVLSAGAKPSLKKPVRKRSEKYYRDF